MLFALIFIFGAIIAAISVFVFFFFFDAWGIITERFVFFTGFGIWVEVNRRNILPAAFDAQIIFAFVWLVAWLLGERKRCYLVFVPDSFFIIAAGVEIEVFKQKADKTFFMVDHAAK